MLQWPNRYENDSYLANNGVTSIQTGDSRAQFVYSPFFGKAIQDVTLNMTGSYYNDFKILNNTHCGGKQPSNTTWHHVYMTNFDGVSCRMQLVSRDLHNYTKQHIGSAAQYRNLHPGTYKSIHDIQKNGKLYIINECYTSSDYYAKNSIQEISSTKGLVLPKALQSFYNNETSINIGELEIPVQDEYVLNYIDPLIEGNIYLKQEGQVYNINGNIPFAGDPFGNIFFVDNEEKVCFYNHETDQVISLEILITDIIN